MLKLSKFGKWSVTSGIGVSVGLLAAYADGVSPSVLLLGATAMSSVVAAFFILLMLNKVLRSKK